MCTVMVMMTFIAPIQNFVKGKHIGALWIAILVLVVGYLGIKVGKSITKSICADSEVSTAIKRKRFWLLVAAMMPIYLIVLTITAAMTGR